MVDLEDFSVMDGFVDPEMEDFVDDETEDAAGDDLSDDDVEGGGDEGAEKTDGSQYFDGIAYDPVFDRPDDDDGRLFDIFGTELRTVYFDEGAVPEQLASAALRPHLPKIFGEFWLEGELSILFADTGKGKSILAVQIADSITRGVPIAPFAHEIEAQKVVYFDFELSDIMFLQRYMRGEGMKATGPDIYPFSAEFRRMTPSYEPSFLEHTYKKFEDYIIESFVVTIERSKAKIVIVDNITFLSGRTNTSAGGALRLIELLKRLRKEYDLSVLVLAHTPKRRFSSGITVNDLQGSKYLSNFADSIFAVGDSGLGEDVRYLKQIKPRNTQLIYGASNVATFRIVKPDNFLHFQFTGCTDEQRHLDRLSAYNSSEKKRLIAKVKKLRSEGHSIREIADILGISRATVARYLRMPD